MTRYDRNTLAFSIFWWLMFIGMIVCMFAFGCTTAKPCEPKIEWKDRVVVVREKCPCLTNEIKKPDIWLLKVDWSKATDEQLALAIKHDNGELVKYAEAMRIACACKETP